MATVAELQERLTMYRKAEAAILEGAQEYSAAGGRRLTRADLGLIQRQIRDLEHRLTIAQSGGQFSHSQAVFGGRR